MGAVWGSGSLPYEMLWRMSVLDHVYRAVSRLRGAVGEEIHRMSDDDRELIAWLIDEGLMD